MAGSYEIWYATAAGQRLGLALDIMSLETVTTFGAVGYAAIEFSSRGQLYDNNVPDRRLHIYHQPYGGTLALEFVAFLDLFTQSTTQDGLTRRRTRGHDANDMLRRRIVAYYTGAAETQISDLADDMMKQVVTDNLIDNDDYGASAPSPSRSISGDGFSVAADLGDGPTVEKSFAWRNVLDVLQDIQAAAKTAGNEVFFGVVPVDETNLEFRTAINQPGADRTVNGNNPLVFSLEWGNLVNPSLSYDYSNEANVVYAGGLGDGDKRTVKTAKDTDAALRAPFALRERFANAARSNATEAVVQDVADEELARRRPGRIFTGEILDTEITPAGGLRGWRVGDRVTVQYAGLSLDVIIRSERTFIGTDGFGRKTARVEDTVTL